LLDALTKRGKLPLWSFFGGATTRLTTDVTVTTGGRDRALLAAKAHAAAGFRSIKIKVGGGDLAADVDRVAAVRAGAPGAAILLDANASLSVADAVALVVALKGQGITPSLFEQPVRAGDDAGLAEVARSTGIPVAADESVGTAADALRLATSRSVQVLNIKTMKTGIAESLDIASIARASGIDLMIGGNVESVLAMTTSACLAAGLGGFAFVDLDTPLFLAENPFDGGYRMVADDLDLTPIEAGHGVVPKGPRSG
jgi:L-alanine-DL-glutamate epimerase-like enolase superfamily enzyme